MVETEAISQGDFCRPRSTEQAHVPLAPTTFRWWPCWGMFFFPIKGTLQMWFGWSLHLGQGGDPEKSDFIVGFHGSNPDSCYGVPATFEAQINSLLPPNLNSSCFWKWTQRCCESLHCPCSWLWLPFKAPNYIYIFENTYYYILWSGHTICLIWLFNKVKATWTPFSWTSTKKAIHPSIILLISTFFWAKQANLRSDLILNSRRLVAKRWS